MNTDRWMVVLTVLLLVISYQQCRISKDTLVVANRAYVLPLNSKVFHTEPEGTGYREAGEQADVGRVRAGDVLSLDVLMTNSGNTPAIRGTPVFMAGISPNFPADDAPLTLGPERVQSAKLMAKDGEMTLPFVTPALTPQDISQIEQVSAAPPKAYLLFIGKVSYRDVFDADQETRFCFFYQWATRTMTACPTHNTAK